MTQGSLGQKDVTPNLGSNIIGRVLRYIVLRVQNNPNKFNPFGVKFMCYFLFISIISLIF